MHLTEKHVFKCSFEKRKKCLAKRHMLLGGVFGLTKICSAFAKGKMEGIHNSCSNEALHVLVRTHIERKFNE
jgi:hypothetical protein